MDKLDIYLFGDIFPYGDEEWGVYDAKYVADQINSNPDAKEIVMHINSNGGDVAEGFAMYDLLKASGKKITTIVEGRCMSIATVVFLAGEERKMTENSVFMIHNPWGWAEGDADEIREYADLLQVTENTIIDFYNEKTGLGKEKLNDMMKVETEFTAEDAKETGFATEVLKTVSAYRKKRGDKAQAIFNHKSFEKMKNKGKGKTKGLPLMQRIQNAVKALGGEEDVQNLAAELEDGTAIEIEGDSISEGAAVTVGGEAAPDGDHTLSDGMVITVKDGMIESVTAAPVNSEEEEEEEPTALDDSEALAKMIGDAVTNAVKPLNEKVDGIINKQEEQEEINNSVADAVELIGNNISSDGFKHKNKRQKFRGAKVKNYSDMDKGDHKKEAILANRKKHDLEKEKGE